MKIVLLLIFAAIQDIKCASNRHRASNRNRQTESCSLNYNGQIGLCQRFSQCPSAQSAYFSYRIFPVYCQYNEADPIVCCSSVSINEGHRVKSPNRNQHIRRHFSQPVVPIQNGASERKRTKLGQTRTKQGRARTGSGQDRVQEGSQFQNCRLNSNEQVGVCRKFSDCLEVQLALKNGRISPVYCQYDRTDPVVCCPSTPISRPVAPSNLLDGRRISEQVCRNIYKERIGHIPVVGGTPAQPNEFPYMCPIGYRKSNGPGYDYKCGGVLISTNFILSAAHCGSVGNAPPDVARVGSISLYDNSGKFPDVPIIQVFIHPNYDKRQIYNDIALFQLGEEQLFHRAACLWTQPVVNVPKVIAMGFGTTEFEGPSANQLMKVALKIYPNAECSRFFPPAEFRIQRSIIDSQVCAGDLEGGRDRCQGDSGGPLVLKTTIEDTKIEHVIGITSFGRGCAGGIPSIYTRVSSYLDWIESIVWPNLNG